MILVVMAVLSMPILIHATQMIALSIVVASDGNECPPAKKIVYFVLSTVFVFYLF